MKGLVLSDTFGLQPKTRVERQGNFFIFPLEVFEKAELAKNL